MAFQQIDATACIADKSLSAALGAFLVRSTAAAHEDRRRGAGFAAPFSAPIRLCGDGSGGGLDEDDYTASCVLPLLWRPGRLDVTEITVELWAKATSGTLAVQAAAKAVTLGAFLSYGPGEEPGGWTTITSTASGRYALTVDLAGLRWSEGDLLVILVAVRSQVGATQVLYDIKASVDTTGLVRAVSGQGNRLTTDPLALWGGADAQADTREAFRVLLGSANTGGSFDPANFEPGGLWGSTGAEYPVQPAYHGLAQDGDEIYLYPYVPAALLTPTATSAVARQAMGALDLLGLHVYESDGGTFNLSEAAVGIGVPASGHVAGLIAQELEDQFTQADGPVALAVSSSTLEDVDLGERVSRSISDNAFTPSGGWSVIHTCVAGASRSQFTPSGGSAEYRNTYVVDALVAWVSANNAGPVEAPLEFRAVLTDSGGDVAGDAVRLACTSIPFSPNGASSTLEDAAFLLGHLFGWTLRGGYAYRGRHSLRDCLPWGLLRRGPSLFRVQVEVTNAGAASPLVGVPLRLEGRFAVNTSYPPGSSLVGHDALHVVALLADWPHSNNPDDLGG